MVGSKRNSARDRWFQHGMANICQSDDLSDIYLRFDIARRSQVMNYIPRFVDINFNDYSLMLFIYIKMKMEKNQGILHSDNVFSYKFKWVRDF
jgi:hypothetical protein